LNTVFSSCPFDFGSAYNAIFGSIASVVNVILIVSIRFLTFIIFR